MLSNLAVGKREAKPSVKLRSPFVNTFGSFSKRNDKSNDKAKKPKLSDLHACPFSVDLLFFFFFFFLYSFP